jgi:carboxyl-terminal processing protease
MHPFDLLVLLATLGALVWPLLPLWSPRWLGLLPTVAVLLCLAHYLVEGLRPTLVPVYVAAGLLWLLTLGRLVRPTAPATRRRARTRRITAIVGRGLGCGLLGLSLLIRATIVTDLSALGWTAAFAALHIEVSHTYAFGAWKAIDWDGLYAEVAPQIAAAEATGDRQAYYRALRTYAFALHDGHVALVGDDRGARSAAVGGSYSFAAIGLDDGRTIAHSVDAAGPAARVGMAWGAQILRWNGQPIDAARRQVATIWADTPPATDAGRQIEQYRFLTRAPIGTRVEVEFKNPGAASATITTLAAVEDQFATLARNHLTPDLSPGDPPVQARTLPGGYSYIRVAREGAALRQLYPMHAYQQAIADAVARNAPGVIIDVRGNEGGLDSMVAEMAGYFYTQPAFYEALAPYDPASGQADYTSALTITIEPRAPHYAGPVAVLIDSDSRSSGEGLPLVLGRLPQTTLIGFAGTHGSFGSPDKFVQLPGGYLFVYTGMQSLDAQRQIQVDSDASGQGGVTPHTRVALTEATVRAAFFEGRDVVLEAAKQILQVSSSYQQERSR